MATALQQSDYQLPGQTDFYRGKVRDVYHLGDDRLVMIASDRISTFDVVLPKGIPFKGQVLNQLAARFMAATDDIVPNWIEAVPDPNVTIGRKCTPYKVEMVIRGYVTGHAWREYRSGKRMLCGVPLPEGLKEHDRLPEPIITPATKAEEGHDEDISREEIIAQGIVPEAEYELLEQYTRQLFARGTALAAEKGLILVDTKYEFGKAADGTILLIDEIHTPDSSRYFYAEGYEQRQARGEQQKQLSKEFVRQWLIDRGFQGLEGQQIPEIPDSYVAEVTAHDVFIELNVPGGDFSHITVRDLGY
ncbi:MAG: phosphoribosylaminoimidazolesuccinocarboxamide synthase, partial [Bacteroidota bacterium]